MRRGFFCFPFLLRTTYAGLASSGSGSTSQNWNCCKPSCAWPGKANVSSPAQSCDITNLPLPDATANSSCQSGTSYMCADQAPWVADPTLAYGFAAAMIKGGNETSWCCACYELLFSSGSAIGKKMIVQVTDSVFDASTRGSQFVLSIPGANFNTGVSSTNSCIAQYGPGGWDSGISSGGKCNNLPVALQIACEWRSSWFGADNPSVNYTQIKCPTELTNKTGCVRADDNSLTEGVGNGFDKRSKIAVGVVVPALLIPGALAGIGIYIKMQRRKAALRHISPHQKVPGKPEIGITKVHKQLYLELDSSPVTNKEAKRASRNRNQFLSNLQPIPKPSLSVRQSMLVMNNQQELEGSSPSELKGDTVAGDSIGKAT